MKRIAFLVLAVLAFAVSAQAVCVGMDIWCDHFTLTPAGPMGGGFLFTGTSDECGGGSYNAYFLISAGPSYQFYWDFDNFGWPPGDNYGIGSGSGGAFTVDRYFSGAYYDTQAGNFSVCTAAGSDSGAASSQK